MCGVPLSPFFFYCSWTRSVQAGASREELTVLTEIFLSKFHSKNSAIPGKVRVGVFARAGGGGGLNM